MLRYRKNSADEIARRLAILALSAMAVAAVTLYAAGRALSWFN